MAPASILPKLKESQLGKDMMKAFKMTVRLNGPPGLALMLIITSISFSYGMQILGGEAIVIVLFK